MSYFTSSNVHFYHAQCPILNIHVSFLLRYPEDNICIFGQQLTLKFHNSSGDMMKQSKSKTIHEDTPEVMLKRVFAIAQIIFQSDSYKNNIHKQEQSRQKTQNQ